MLSALSASTHTPDDAHHGSALRVLIIEDSPMVRARLTESFAEIPNVDVVGEADTEPEALALMRHKPWDVTVLDLQLKRGSGLGVLRAMAEGDRPQRTRIIVFTNFAFPQYRERSLKLGADYFLDKARELGRVRAILGELADPASRA